MNEERENPREFNVTYSKTGETVKYKRTWCKCGHTMNFISRHPAICHKCGRVVYPDKKLEFIENMKKKLKK